jgi:hypothetical protein
MKICPKCNSSYSDETLNFCLTDGVALVVEEALAEHISTERSWHDAETLVDSRLPATENPHRTASSENSPTMANIHAGTTTFQTKKSATPVYAILGVLLVAVLAAGSFWWFSRNQGASVPAVSSENKPATPNKPAAQLTAQQENLLKTEIADFLNSWRETNEKKDIDAHIAHYAELLKVYYSDSNKDKNHVRADRLRAYQRYEMISMQLDKMKIVPESTEAATVTFDKTWTMKNPQRTSTGSVQQEIHVVKIKGKWLIDAEKDVKVYYINNRDDADANANVPENSPANAPKNTNSTSNQ